MMIEEGEERQEAQFLHVRQPVLFCVYEWLVNLDAINLYGFTS